MKKVVLALLGVSSLALGACANQDAATPESTSVEATPTTSEAPRDGLVEGVVGKMHGMDCIGEGECSVQFTVDELSVVDSCMNDITGIPVDGPFVDLRATISTANTPNTPGFDSSFWALSTEWSVLDSAGNDVPIHIESACLPEAGWRGTWEQENFPGDTRTTEQRFRIPTDAQVLRLTDKFNQGRWEFELPEMNSADTTPPPAAAPTAPANHVAPAPAAATVEQAPAAVPPTVIECLPGTPGPARWSDGTVAYSETCYQQGVSQPGYVNEGDITQRFWECMKAGGTEETCRQ